MKIKLYVNDRYWSHWIQLSYRFLQMQTIIWIGKSVSFSSITEAKTSKKDNALKRDDYFFFPILIWSLEFILQEIQ